MKKKVALLLLTTIVAGTMMTACGSADDRTSDEVQTENVGDENDMVETESTVGNTTVEEPTTEGTVVEESIVADDQAATGGADHLATFEEVDAFINEIYTKVPQDMMPGGVGNMELGLEDMEAVTYYTGLTDATGVDSIVVSESMIGSVAYSLLYIRTNDEGDAQQIAQNVMDNINPAKWICVTAEKQLAVTIGKDVLFVMTAPETADLIYDAVVEIAGQKGMAVSEKLEKTNAI